MVKLFCLCDISDLSLYLLCTETEKWSNMELGHKEYLLIYLAPSQVKTTFWSFSDSYVPVPFFIKTFDFLDLLGSHVKLRPTIKQRFQKLERFQVKT